MKHLLNKKVLVTTQNFFVGPDGIEYKAAWGTLKAIHTSQETLSFTPSRANTNWFVEIGSMIIAGCQVLYLIECTDVPHLGRAKTWSTNHEKGIWEYERPSMIFKAE